MLAGLVVMAPAAAAEGEFESYLYRVQSGFNSRHWDDHNLDANPTLVHFVNCTSNPEIALYEDLSLRPDRQVGNRQISWCLNTNGPWLSWGRLPAGKYYFKITNPRSADGFLSVDYVHVAW
jgi:hypothetical protein